MAYMTEEEYRRDPGVNKSTLWEIRKSPLHYKYALENPGEDTPALVLGRAVHMAVLQPEEFVKHYRVAPSGIDRRTKEGKAAWSEFMASVALTQEILTMADLEVIQGIQNSVNSNLAARSLLKDSMTELPLFWTDEDTGMRCKCRIDSLKETEDKIILTDLKTTNDASVDSFERNAIKYGYHVQAAHYINGVEAAGRNYEHKKVEWWFIAVEKKPPYAVHVMQVDQFFLDVGQTKLNELMWKLKVCKDNDFFPGYGTDVITAPEWALEEDEEE